MANQSSFIQTDVEHTYELWGRGGRGPPWQGDIIRRNGKWTWVVQKVP